MVSKSHITRKIYFYKLHAGITMNGEPIPYNITSALEAIERLEFDKKGRYLKDEDEGYDVCCWIHSSSYPQKVAFGKIKRDNFPQVEHRGQLSPLTVPDESGLVDCVHVMFFPENIVGIECNYDGPRVSRIADYLHIKSQSLCAQMPVFDQLLQPDVIKKLEHMMVVKKFRLKIRNALFSSYKKDEYLAKVFDAAGDLGSSRDIELILSVGRGGGSLGTRILNIAKNVFLLRETSKDMISGEITGLNDAGTTDVIDLLKAKLVAKKEIPKDTSASGKPRSDFFYSAIEEAYEELKDQLLIAVGVTLCPV